MIKRSNRRQLNNENFLNLYTLPVIIKTIKSNKAGRARHVTSMMKVRNAYKILGGKPQSKIALGSRRPNYMEKSP
jgi:hypothetical protein